jgi:hypothetical protein
MTEHASLTAAVDEIAAHIESVVAPDGARGRVSGLGRAQCLPALRHLPHTRVARRLNTCDSHSLVALPIMSPEIGVWGMPIGREVSRIITHRVQPLPDHGHNRSRAL